MDSQEPPKGSKQEFIGPIGNVAGRDVINNFRSEDDEDLDAERKQQLTRRAYVLEAKFGLATWQSRRLVNEVLGVLSQDVMRAKHFSRASKVYDLLFEIEEAKLKASGSAEAASLRNEMADTLLSVTLRNGQLTAENENLRAEYAALAQREKSARTQADAARVQAEASRVEAEAARAQASQASHRPANGARLPRHLIIATAFVGIALVALGSLYEVRYAHSSTSIPHVSEQACQGRSLRSYRVGSVVRGSGGTFECVASASGASANWVKVR